MPTDKVSTCPDFVLQKIANQALSTQSLAQDRGELGVGELCTEVATQYSRTMNKMIFDKVIGTEQEKHLLKDLELPPEPEKEEVPWKGRNKEFEFWGTVGGVIVRGAGVQK